MNFGEMIRSSRDHMGLSQELAAKMIREKYGVRISSAYLSMIERGERKNLTSKLEVALKDFFSIQQSNANDVQNNPEPSLPNQSMSIPILGTIRAGLPILADENIEGYMEIPENLRADYILRVQGDSMIGAGILDGDLVICKEAQTAFSGQIVVALHDESTGFSEATLKYYFDVNGSGPVLRPANPQYSEIEIKDGYRVAGVMVALVRSDAPGYQIYRNYLAANDSEEWAEVIEKAAAAGIKPERMNSFIEMLKEMK